MTNSNKAPTELNDTDLETARGGTGGVLWFGNLERMKGEVMSVQLADSYDLTTPMKRGLRSDGDLVQSGPERK